MKSRMPLRVRKQCETVDLDFIFNNLNKILEEDKVYTNLQLNRRMIAEQLHTNERYLHQAVSKNTGLGVMQYINQFRLQHACRLLLDDKQPIMIKEIAIMAGFGSRASLYRIFQKCYGMAPAEYRIKGNHI